MKDSKLDALCAQYPNALEQALGLAAAGIKVFPVSVFRSGDKWKKAPAIAKSAGGSGHRDATTDPDQIREWFSRRGKRIVGLPATDNGWLILDFDGPTGRATLQGLEDEHGELVTFAVGTGDGLHLYLQHPGGMVKNRAGVLPGMDVRTQGWVVAPSPTKSPGEKRYKIIDGSAIAEAPEWLVEIVGREVTAAQERATVDGTVTEGTRDNTLSAYVYRLRKQKASRATSCSHWPGRRTHASTRRWTTTRSCGCVDGQAGRTSKRHRPG